MYATDQPRRLRSVDVVCACTALLVSTGAAKWATEHLGKDKDAWERLVFMFAQREQLPALGDHVPVSPRLSQLAYTAVAASYVPHEQHHAELARLLHRWPQPLLNDIAEEVTQIISHRIQNSTGPHSVDIHRALARLLDVQAHSPFSPFITPCRRFLFASSKFSFEYLLSCINACHMRLRWCHCAQQALNDLGTP
jgi:hypothetical protein